MYSVCIVSIVLLYQGTTAQSDLRCRGRNFPADGDGSGRCCTTGTPCIQGEGDCEDDTDCADGLMCGENNCKNFGDFFHERDDCCVKQELRCRGRHFDTERCCTKENPCVEGEGDWDSDDDCGLNLVCGDNNCKMFGDFFHKKDDCCIKKLGGAVSGEIPFEPPEGQRCAGRNYAEDGTTGKRCCTPEDPCDEGEGDCDGRGDGGLNDGHAGCKGNLVCGSNNCLKFGAYYHEKDDCCEKSSSPVVSAPKSPGGREEQQGWGLWSDWGPCSHTCGAGRKTRRRQCLGKCQNHHLFENQERICINPECNFL